MAISRSYVVCQFPSGGHLGPSDDDLQLIYICSTAYVLATARRVHGVSALFSGWIDISSDHPAMYLSCQSMSMMHPVEKVCNPTLDLGYTTSAGEAYVMHCGEEIRKNCRLGATSNYTTNFIIIVFSGDDNDDGSSLVSISTECSASAESDMDCLSAAVGISQ